MLYSYGYCYFPQSRRDLCGNLKCEGWTQGAEQMHVTPKGRRDAEDAEDAGLV